MTAVGQTFLSAGPGDCPNFRLSENGTVPFPALAEKNVCLNGLRRKQSLLLIFLKSRHRHNRYD